MCEMENTFMGLMSDWTAEDSVKTHKDWKKWKEQSVICESTVDFLQVVSFKNIMVTSKKILKGILQIWEKSTNPNLQEA